MSISIDPSELMVRLLKYALEGFILGTVAFFISNSRLTIGEVTTLGLVAAATFAVLDLFAPSIGASVRSGAGYGIGFNLVGFPS